MSLDQFKVIYWWEWTHRLLGAHHRRGVPAAVSVFPVARLGAAAPEDAAVDHVRRRRLSRRGRLVDGVVGAGRLRTRQRVAISPGLPSDARLRDLLRRAVDRAADRAAARRARRRRGCASARWPLAVLVLLQIYLGALVAGANAGLVYNTWPLIDGSFIPAAAACFHASGLAQFLREHAHRAVRPPHGGLCDLARCDAARL